MKSDGSRAGGRNILLGGLYGFVRSIIGAGKTGSVGIDMESETDTRGSGENSVTKRLAPLSMPELIAAWRASVMSDLVRKCVCLAKKYGGGGIWNCASRTADRRSKVNGGGMSRKVGADWESSACDDIRSTRSAGMM